ncbi:hypothetical protein Gotur_005661 [Gossypium turneri]
MVTITSFFMKIQLLSNSNQVIHHNPYMFPFSSPIAGRSQWPSSSPFLIAPSGPPMYRPASYEGSQEGPSGSSSFLPNPITI